MKGCVIGTGGAYGAYGVGTLKRLNKDYDAVMGGSTGALMVPFVALKQWDRLEEAYTNTKQSDIFNYNPFKKNGNISVLKVLWRILLGKKTWGETKNLRKTIDRYFDHEDHMIIKRLGKKVFVAVQEVSARPYKVHYFECIKNSYEDFKDWMWASASAPPVGSLIYKNDKVWTDVGLTEMVSIKHLIDLGCDEIDIIVHRINHNIPASLEHIDNNFDLLQRLLVIMKSDIEVENVEAGISYAREKGVKLNFYYIPRQLNGIMEFNKKKMKEWVKEGFETALDSNRIEVYDFKN